VPYLLPDSAALIRAKGHELSCKGSSEIKDVKFVRYGRYVFRI
jgi:hypothetical protein